MHRLRGLRQPLPKNKAVQRAKDQPLGAACRTRYHADVLRPQAVLLDVAARDGAGVKAKGFQAQGPAVYFFKPCSLAKAEAMALPCPAGSGRWL